MGHLLESPVHPFVAVMGGAKVSDKIGVIQNILDKVNSLLIGGGMAANFLKAQGLKVGASVVEEEKLSYTLEMLNKAQSKGVRIILPVDVMVCDKLEAGALCRIVSVNEIPDDWIIADIGPETNKLFVQEKKGSKTVFWNGPMGVFEIEPFSMGTRRVARAVAASKATTVIGGGSTAEAVEEMGLVDQITHVSTGGGASLELLEGKELPGVAVLQSK
jgi:phosphoglycerate kinase